MAKGAAAAAKADAAISVTGIAGPDGGTKEKPVGLVYIGCYVQGKVTVKECHFSGSRSEIRQATVESCLLYTSDAADDLLRAFAPTSYHKINKRCTNGGNSGECGRYIFLYRKHAMMREV